MTTFCYKSISDSDYGKAIKQYVELSARWGGVLEKVSDLLNESVTKMARDPKELYIDVNEVTKETRKLFTKDGKLKKNSKKANDLRKEYMEITKGLGLSEYEEKGLINFHYGIMRTCNTQRLESFVSSDGVNYMKANFDLNSLRDVSSYIKPISEIEFEETYLNELKKKEDSQ